jgi:hypothetical protein
MPAERWTHGREKHDSGQKILAAQIFGCLVFFFFENPEIAAAAVTATP